MLQNSYDIKTWITGHVRTMRDHTKPKCFKFETNGDDKVDMFYRNWGSDEWFGTFDVIVVI